MKQLRVPNKEGLFGSEKDVYGDILTECFDMTYNKVGRHVFNRALELERNVDESPHKVFFLLQRMINYEN